MKKDSQKQCYTIQGTCTAELKIRRSRFICSLKHVETTEQAKQFISAVSAEHKKATHNCWAYIVGNSGETSHSSDAGEPSGSAGRPMLNTLNGFSMTHVAAVVTRYFGGVKLGIKGLMEAYSSAVREAVDQKKLTKVTNTRKYIIQVPYTFNDTFTYYLKQIAGEIITTDYSAAVTHEIAVEEIDWDTVETFLQKYQDAGTLEYTLVKNDP